MNEYELYQEQLKKIDELTASSYDSPKFKIWYETTKKLLEENFEKRYADLFEECFRQTVIAHDQAELQQMHIEQLQKAKELLIELETEAKRLPITPAGLDLSLAWKLHPAVEEKCSKLFKDGHYATAIETGFKVVRDRLRDLTGFETGSDAFGRGRLKIEGAIASYVEDDFNEAVKFLCMSIDRFRNEKAHCSDGKISDPNKAREYLAMASLAMRLLDNAAILE